MCESFESAVMGQMEFKPQHATYSAKVIDLAENKREAEKMFSAKTRQLTTVVVLEETRKREVKAKEKGLGARKESKLKRAKH